MCGYHPGATHAHCQSQASPAVHAAYASWVDHYNECEHCRQFEVMNPGAPQLVPAGYGDRTVYPAQGGIVDAIDAADPQVLCCEGRRLYRRWVRAASGEPV